MQAAEFGIKHRSNALIAVADTVVRILHIKFILAASSKEVQQQLALKFDPTVL